MRLQGIIAVAAVAELIGGTASAGAQAKTPPNATKGQGQVSGLYASFGTTYTLKSNFNFSIIKARYTLEPFTTSEPISAKTEEKLIVIDLAIKNVAKDDNAFGTDTRAHDSGG